MEIKSTRGITLTMLAIVAMVMAIIAGVTMYYGSGEVEKSREQKLLSEVKIVNQAVYQSYINYAKTKDTSYLVGDKIAKSDANYVANKMGIALISIPSTYEEAVSSYYRLIPSNLEKIGITGSKDIYIVNYLTGEVMNETQIKTESGEPLYTYSVSNFNTNDATAF